MYIRSRHFIAGSLDGNILLVECCHKPIARIKMSRDDISKTNNESLRIALEAATAECMLNYLEEFASNFDVKHIKAEAVKDMLRISTDFTDFLVVRSNDHAGKLLCTINSYHQTYVDDPDSTGILNTDSVIKACVLAVVSCIEEDAMSIIVPFME
jgi:hypothetical protein